MHKDASHANSNTNTNYNTNSNSNYNTNSNPKGKIPVRKGTGILRDEGRVLRESEEVTEEGLSGASAPGEGGRGR